MFLAVSPLVGGGREGNLPRTASELHFTYLWQCASPEDFRTCPKQSSGKDLPFIIVNFYLKRDYFNYLITVVDL